MQIVDLHFTFKVPRNGLSSAYYLFKGFSAQRNR